MPSPHSDGQTGSEIEILYDRYGVPHIYARNLQSAMFGVGHCQAKDRLFQMELLRRLARGRLSEILGESTLESDRLSRHLCIERSSEADEARLEAGERALLQSYCNGINRYIDTHRDKLPLEFNILKLSPRPWRPSDTIAISRYISWTLTENWASEFLSSWIINKFGRTTGHLLRSSYPAGKPVIIPSGGKAVEAEKLWETEVEKMREPVIANPPTMSNNWVVDGQKSETGHPLLANDPHLPLSIPGIWHEIHMQCPEAQVIGAGIPGLPGVIIGHNGHIAWGITNAGVDCSDLYVERIENENAAGRFQEGDVWKDAESFQEEIMVKGRLESHVERVLSTHHGPLLDHVLPGETRNIAIQSVPLGEASSSMGAITRLWKAKTWDEFREALSHWETPASNFVYADKQGNIGYQLAGKVPIRRSGYGLIPSPGWTGAYDWIGYVPFDDLPSELNPPTHYLATANNKIVNDDYPHYLGGSFAFYRAERIIELLEAKNILSVADFKKIQLDLYSISARELIHEMQRLDDTEGQVGEALGYLRAWDHVLSPESIPASIFEVFVTILCRRALEEKLGKQDSEILRGRPFVPSIEFVYGAPWLIQKIKQYPDWFKELTWPQVMRDSLASTVEELTRLLGKDVSQWKWGRLHTQVFAHPLGQSPELSKTFNRGPISIGGDGSTVWASHFTPFYGYAARRVGVSYRQIIDLANPEESIAVLPTGQSENPTNRHYDDMMKMWQDGEYHPLLWNRDSVEKQAESRETIFV